MSMTVKAVLPAAGLACALGAGAIAGAPYAQHNLVSDGFVAADHIDPLLLNPWGIAFNPNGFDWIANNHSGTSTLYDGFGVANSLVVNIPSPTGPTGGNPTGIVFSNGGNFALGPNGTNPAAFLFATESGLITGWNPTLPPPPPSTQAHIAVNNSGGVDHAIYKGLAINTAQDRLYATDFHNARVDVFNGTFGGVDGTSAFTDPTLPSGYAPFNAQRIGASIFVTYALQDAAREDEVAGAGFGYVDEYSDSGAFIRRFASQGALNAPWAMALAPSDFGTFSSMLLIGNFGDGRINVFDPATGAQVGVISDATDAPIEIEGLWGLAFGNDLLGQAHNTLFFTAGAGDEQHGLYGAITFVPGGGTALTVLAGMGMLAGRRRRG